MSRKNSAAAHVDTSQKTSGTGPTLEQALPWEHEQMAWDVHYWDEINKRNITSREINTREDAMDEACSLMQRHTVSHVAGPNGERIDIKEIREWCSTHTSR
jgi:hypothetical protein